MSLLLTPKLLSRSWDVISVIRNPAQKPTILSAAPSTPRAGNLSVLVTSIEDVKSTSDAQKILNETKPDWVVWSAGAGGKGGKERTYAIDRDAASYFIRAAVNTPTVSKFLLVSAMSIRRQKAEWWSDEGYAFVRKVNEEIMPDYYKAKLAADEVLTVLGEQRREKDPKFQYVILRPGQLTDGEETGKVSLGKTDARGSVTRADVASVAAELLETEANGWFDLLGGTEGMKEAVERVVKEGVDSREGESIEVMKKDLAETV